MANLLLIETTTAICSVGLSRAGQPLLLRTAPTDYAHARLLTTLIDDLMTSANMHLSDLDAIALSSGPGSYTSLRVGAATAKGIGFALNKPLIVVSTLAALAAASHQPDDTANTYYLPMIDARRMEVYTGCYDHSGAELQPPQALVITTTSFAELREQGHPLVLSGDGAEKCRPLLGEVGIIYRTDLPHSAAYLELPARVAYDAKQWTDLAYYEPLYLKPPYVTQARKQL